MSHINTADKRSVLSSGRTQKLNSVWESIYWLIPCTFLLNSTLWYTSSSIVKVTLRCYLRHSVLTSPRRVVNGLTKYVKHAKKTHLRSHYIQTLLLIWTNIILNIFLFYSFRSPKLFQANEKVSPYHLRVLFFRLLNELDNL